MACSSSLGKQNCLRPLVVAILLISYLASSNLPWFTRKLGDSGLIASTTKATVMPTRVKPKNVLHVLPTYMKYRDVHIITRPSLPSMTEVAICVFLLGIISMA